MGTIFILFVNSFKHSIHHSVKIKVFISAAACCHTNIVAEIPISPSIAEEKI